MPRPKAPLASSDDIEQQFYEAMRHGDIDRVMALWADEDEIVCVHPAGPRRVGAAAIRASFEAIFAGGGVDVRTEQVRRLLLPGSAVHHVLERVQALTDEGPRTAWVIATNVYMKAPQGWRLVLHHASPGSLEELHDVVEAAATLH